MNKSQVKTGVVLAYILIVLNTLYGLVLTPYILSNLGNSEYGVYKTISSMASSLMVLDLGIGGTMMRYIAKYRAEREEGKIPNFIAMNLIQAAMLCSVIAVISLLVYNTIGKAYSETFTTTQIIKAERLFVILVINLIFHVFENVINGVINGCNHFAFGNGVKLARLVLRVILIWAILKIYKNSEALALIDLLITITTLIFEIYYVYRRLGIHIKYSKWERSLFFESGKYTFFMFLTSIAAQANGNLNNVIIGAIAGPIFVSVYSIALLFYAMYMYLATSISGVLLPTVTNILAKMTAETELHAFIVRVGRLQFLLLGAAAVGFACIGKDFIHIWLGDGYEDVYIITLILMIPTLFELCVNVCLSILRARNMLAFRTIILVASTVLNLILTFIAVKYWSYIGAALGTAVSYVSNQIIMNIYYTKKLHLPILRIYRKIFSKIWVCLSIAGMGLFITSRYLYGSILAIGANVIIFCVIYGTTLLLYGLNKSEKKLIPIFKIHKVKEGV